MSSMSMLMLSAKEISESRPSFEAELMVSKNVDRMLVNTAFELVVKVVEECSILYKFDSKEAIELLNLGKITIVDKKKVVEKKVVEKKEKVVKERRSKEKEIPLPFNGVRVMDCCDGLTQNHGLYTQCKNAKMEGEYCKKCDKEAKSNENGKPDNGTMEDRLSVGLMDFKAPNGKGVVAYTKVMKKLKLSKEAVLSEAEKRNVEINECHLSSPESKKGRPKAEVQKEKSDNAAEKKKGRPKKSKKVLEIETNDVFASLIAATNEENEVDEVEKELESILDKFEEVVSVSVPTNVAKESAEKKKAAKDAAKEAEKAAKDAAKAAEKAAKDAAKAAEKAAKDAEKAAKDAEKAAKDAEKEAEKKKKDEAKAAKEAEKAAKPVTKKEKAVVETKPIESASVSTSEEQPAVKCVVINAKGQTKKTGLQDGDKKFLKSSNGEILSFTTQEKIGTWNKVENRIVFDEEYVESEEDEDSEEEEEEYDE